MNKAQRAAVPLHFRVENRRSGVCLKARQKKVLPGLRAVVLQRARQRLAVRQKQTGFQRLAIGRIWQLRGVDTGVLPVGRTVCAPADFAVFRLHEKRFYYGGMT